MLCQEGLTQKGFFFSPDCTRGCGPRCITSPLIFRSGGASTSRSDAPQSGLSVNCPCPHASASHAPPGMSEKVLLVPTLPYRQGRSFLAYAVSGTPTFVLANTTGKVQSVLTGYRPEVGLAL